MKRMEAFLLALLMLCLCACTAEPPVVPSEPSLSASVETEPVQPGADPVDDQEDPVEKLLANEEGLLLAARRAAAREFDKLWYDCPHDDMLLMEYYSGTEAQVSDSALLQRAQALAAVTADPDRLKREGDSVLYRAFLPRDGEWVERWVELDLGEHDCPSKTVTERFITAVLENDRVFLSFDDTPEAAYYLMGYGDDGYDYQDNGRGFLMPCDSLELGADHEYEVQGAFSRYKDLFLGNISAVDYTPCLFLVTEDDALEMVDITGCFRYGAFCALPIPGHFDGNSLPAPTVEDDGGIQTVLVTDAYGAAVDMVLPFAAAQRAVPRGSWSGMLEEIQTAGGSYARIADLSLRDDGSALELTVSELDAPVSSAALLPHVLGMTGEGIVCGYTCFPFENEFPCGGAFAWSAGTETEDHALWLRVISGVSPIGYEGEWLTFCRIDTDCGTLASDPAAFTGFWGDEVSGRCEMSISWSDFADYFAVYVTWGDSAFETYAWEMTAYPVPYEAALYYSDCTCRIVSYYGVDGSETVKEVLYTGGSGTILLDEPGVLLWHDDNDPHTYDCRFTPVNVEGW